MRRHINFLVGDEVMAHFKKTIFPIGTHGKLKMRKFGPCWILRKFDNGNVFEVDFLMTWIFHLYLTFLICISITSMMMD